MNDLQTSQIEIDRNKKLEQIGQLVKLLDNPEAIEKEVQKIAREEKGLFRQMSRMPVSAGHFYEFDIFSHSTLVIVLSALVMHSTKLFELPDDARKEIEENKHELPEWIDLEDEDNLRANMFGGYYTLNKSILAINAQGKSINQLLDEGLRRNDRGAFKQAVKLDPVAITSPQVSSMLMLAEAQGRKHFRNDLHNALKKPYLRSFTDYPKLRFIVWALREEGLLQDMSEIERYQFLHIQLNLYKNNVDGEDHQDSLNRMIRRWEAEYRT